MGDLSPHFDRAEFACRHCGRTQPTPQLQHLVGHLEKLRAIVGRPLRIVSGYRCPTHDRAVRGKRTTGQHAAGTAVDLPVGYATVAQAEQAGFVGIGSRGVYAVHVDLRKRRARWRY